MTGTGSAEVAAGVQAGSAAVAAGMSTAKKLYISATVILLNFNVTLASSLPSGAEPTLSAHFGVTSELEKPLPVAVFLVGYIFGPIIVAPVSESWGRRPVFLASFAIHTAFTLACALAPSWPTFLFFRFMLGCGAAAPQTVSGGLFCDIYPDLGPHGMAVTLLGLTSNFWCALILAGLNWPMLLFMPETFAPVLCAGEKIAKPQNCWDYVRTITRPIRILSEPLVFFTDLFILYQYVIFFLYFGVYPVIFRRVYSMSDGVAALMFIPIGIGAILAIAIFAAWDKFHRTSTQRGKAWALREEYRRLPLACLGGPFIPALSGVALGVGIDLTFLALNNYLTDAYDIYSASALASSVCTRNVLAAILLPLTTYPLYENLGTNWACTLLGCLCFALTPIPFAFIRWGPSMRRRSPFCQELARNTESGIGADKSSDSPTGCFRS
ncbi:MFS general substrate transporter [Madurella fahalii]|uniref:MFS general substrate transporter n=1 Tax=Madurella fahalii TaxID=1157608 RepID=A0ABQ0GGI6_9PEZI